jgi:hypothetical protein
MVTSAPASDSLSLHHLEDEILQLQHIKCAYSRLQNYVIQSESSNMVANK